MDFASHLRINYPETAVVFLFQFVDTREKEKKTEIGYYA